MYSDFTQFFYQCSLTVSESNTRPHYCIVVKLPSSSPIHESSVFHDLDASEDTLTLQNEP